MILLVRLNSAPFLDLLEAGQRRPEPVRQISGGKAGEETVQDVDDGVRQDGAELDAFGRQGDEEGAAAGRPDAAATGRTPSP